MFGIANFGKGAYRGRWLVDSGASHHLVCDRKWFSSYEPAEDGAAARCVAGRQRSKDSIVSFVGKFR